MKTRLASEIGAEAALGLYVAMLRDTLSQASEAALRAEARAVLSFTPPTAMEVAAQPGAPSLSELWSGLGWPQPGGDLGARMHGAIEWALENGASSVALLGADTPDMSVDEVVAAFERLQSGPEDVLLGPARDGGFWTLMCRRPLPREAFLLGWERDDTLEPLKDNLEALGLRVGCGLSCGLSPGDDVDDAAALRRLGQRLCGRGPKYLGAVWTARWLEENRWL